MTINELLAMLGRAWPRLLIYPGGLVALALVWLLVRTKNQEPRISRPTNDQRLTTTASEYVRQSIEAFRFSILHSQFPIPNFWLDLSAIVLPWLGLALLPLPHAAAIGRQTDLIAVFALLEWPLLLTIAAERDGDAASQRRLAAILNGYPPLILATLVQISAAGSFDLAVLARSPAEEAPARVALLRWLGSAAWLLALPPALGVGAFASRAPAARALQIGLGLRAIGLIAIAALPWFPLVVTIDENAPVTAGARWLLLPLPPLIIVGLLWGFARLTAGQSPRRWARVYLMVDVALLLVSLWAAYSALQGRLA